MLSGSWDGVRQGVTLQIGTAGKDRSDRGQKTSLTVCAVHGKLQPGVGGGSGYGQDERCFWGGGEVRRKGKAVSGQAV